MLENGLFAAWFIPKYILHDKLLGVMEEWTK